MGAGISAHFVGYAFGLLGIVHRRPRLLYVVLRLTPGQPLSMRDDCVFGFVYGPRGIWDGGEEGLGGVVFGGVGLAGDREPISGLVFWSLAKSNAEKTLYSHFLEH